jgi:hypothetical protein
MGSALFSGFRCVKTFIAYPPVVQPFKEPFYVVNEQSNVSAAQHDVPPNSEPVCVLSKRCKPT